MSSRFGPRPIGTDGTDFRHRQKVAAHYKESVTNKFRLKLTLGAHAALLALMLLKLFETILDWFSIDWGPLERLNVPEPWFWEWWWTYSAFAVAFGLMALPRNRVQYLTYCYYALFAAGLVPLAVGAGAMLPDLARFIRDPTRELASGRLLGCPMVVLWFMFFVTAIQIHAFSMYFALQLIKVWQPAAKTAENGDLHEMDGIADDKEKVG